MISMSVSLSEPAFPDFAGKPTIHLQNTIRVTALAGGMQSGAPSVAFGFELPDGSVVIAETSLALFLSAARMFRVRFGDALPKTVREAQAGEILLMNDTLYAILKAEQAKDPEQGEPDLVLVSRLETAVLWLKRAANRLSGGS